jgi:lysophospholipase L1-like esterase
MLGLRCPNLFVVVCAGLLISASCALAQQPPPSISWEVKNRFRLFERDTDFERHVSAHKTAIAQGAKLADLTLKTEQVLARQTNGHGWARDITAICVDATGQLKKSCRRDPDGTVENYINPENHFVELRVAVPPNLTGAQCTWTIEVAPSPQQIVKPCDQPIDRRFQYGAPTSVRVVAQKAGEPPITVGTQVQVRDVLVVGIGDSIASGEGNPDKPIALGAANQGFCFRTVTPTVEYAVPTRAGVDVVDDCSGGFGPDAIEAWEKTTAGWMSRACHRSLYGYQMRSALALAIEYPQIAVTYVPLGCTGAEVKTGLLGPQLARERRWYGTQTERKYVDAQITQLQSDLGAKPAAKFRKPDLIFLTIGANDIGFSGLVADIMFNPGNERDLVRRAGDIVTPQQAASRVDGLRENFKLLRTSLHQFTDGDLKRVVFVSYYDPTRDQAGNACQNSKRGFDIHPNFSYNEATAKSAEQFIRDSFFPTLKRIALCEQNGGCADAAKDTMTFVDQHQGAFEKHGVCAVNASDPSFDSGCFRNGDSFNPRATGLTQPLRCGRSPAEYRAYASRQRWIRSPNDAFFSAMTYPAPPFFLLEPASIHDALWGVLSAVYGGAIHPSAEGHAAMADAALVAARSLLGLTPPQFHGP